IVADDVSRPTPVHQFVELVLDELRQAGISDNHIEFMMALGTHRPMNREEIAQKLGDRVASRYRVHNHQWDNPDCLDYIGETDQGVPVWINTMVRQADLVIGLGSIMPIEVCGFTGGGKILVPGVSGQVTVDQMHWTRIDVPSQYILGRVENPIRASIDALARKAGLDFIVNVILDAQNRIIGAVAGDMIAAHRCGCEIARKVYGVPLDREYDIVIADSFPFDNEFWQANKALSTTGEFVKKGGVVILVTPCHEGFSQTHGEILEFGYLPIEQIKQMVNNGAIKHKVVGVHMAQASAVAIEKARLILVSTGIRRQQAKQVGFNWAPTPQDAFNQAVDICDSSAKVAVLKNASRMLPLKSSME
ncbi:MAG: nickel-dependent lactate racemase, partial [Sedimentisphaerales bacterium]|nr:nickel-dependent lactate racemase [Sedimentisphaerales bacterium]